jgi:lipopolysaccharide transport system permease protein
MSLNQQKTVYTAEPNDFKTYIFKIIEFKALIKAFAVRDLKVKYASTFLGLGWTILQPLAGLTIFTFFFGFVLGWKANNTPYSLYVLSGLLGWNFFSYIVFQGSSCIHDGGQIIKEIYYPKFILPLSKVLVAFVEVFVSFLLLIPLMIWYQIYPSWQIIFLPIAFLLTILCALSIVVWVSSFAYKKRDLLHVVPFLMYFGIWLTPVFFTFDTLPEQFQFLWFFNPMAGVVELWRLSLFADWSFSLKYLPSILLMFPVFLIGFKIYIKKEFLFSDFV